MPSSGLLGAADVWLDVCRAKVLENLRNMPFAPSAQMQQVPYYEDDDDGDSDEELDVRLSGKLTVPSLAPFQADPTAPLTPHLTLPPPRPQNASTLSSAPAPPHQPPTNFPRSAPSRTSPRTPARAGPSTPAATRPARTRTTSRTAAGTTTTRSRGGSATSLGERAWTWGG